MKNNKLGDNLLKIEIQKAILSGVSVYITIEQLNISLSKYYALRKELYNELANQDLRLKQELWLQLNMRLEALYQKCYKLAERGNLQSIEQARKILADIRSLNKLDDLTLDLETETKETTNDITNKLMQLYEDVSQQLTDPTK